MNQRKQDAKFHMYALWRHIGKSNIFGVKSNTKSSSDLGQGQ
jgi:hypothetical protein